MLDDVGALTRTQLNRHIVKSAAGGLVIWSASEGTFINSLLDPQVFFFVQCTTIQPWQVFQRDFTKKRVHYAFSSAVARSTKECVIGGLVIMAGVVRRLTLGIASHGWAY